MIAARNELQSIEPKLGETRFFTAEKQQKSGATRPSEYLTDCRGAKRRLRRSKEPARASKTAGGAWIERAVTRTRTNLGHEQVSQEGRDCVS